MASTSPNHQTDALRKHQATRHNISRTAGPSIKLLGFIRAAVVVAPARARPILQAPMAAAAKVQHFKRSSQRCRCPCSAAGITRRGARQFATHLHQQQPHLRMGRLVRSHVVLPGLKRSNTTGAVDRLPPTRLKM